MSFSLDEIDFGPQEEELAGKPTTTPDPAPTTQRTTDPVTVVKSRTVSKEPKQPPEHHVLATSELGDAVLGKTPDEMKAPGFRPKANVRALAEKFGGPAFRANENANLAAVGNDVPIEWFDAKKMLQLASEPINWAVRDFWTERAKIVVAAEQKAGKTFLVCALAVSQMSGIPFLDKFEIAQPGPVIIIAGEDDARESARRIHRFCRSQQICMSDLPLLFWPAQGFKLNRPREIAELRKKAREVRPRLIIADPLARLMDGDENSKDCVASVLNPSAILAEEIGASFCWVHHLGKPPMESGTRTQANRVRGSSDIASWFSCGIFLTGSMDDKRIQLEVLQRTGGNIPHKFHVDIMEGPDEGSPYERGTIKMVAKLDESMRYNQHEDSDAELDRMADLVQELLDSQGDTGCGMTEMVVRLKMRSTQVRAAVERLLTSRGTAKAVAIEEPGLEKVRYYSCESQREKEPAPF